MNSTKTPSIITHLDEFMAGVAQLVRAPGCGSGGRRFETGFPPHSLISDFEVQNGDLVYLIAPSYFPSEVNHSEISEYLSKLETCITDHFGLKTHIDPQILSVSCLPYANVVAYRKQQLVEAFNSDAKIIWCMRGGAGMNQIISTLDDVVLDKPKILIGYSDITCLHNALNKRVHWPSIHGNMVTHLEAKPNQQQIDDLKSMLFSQTDDVHYKLTPFANCNNEGTIGGRVTGGNLAVICSNLGTEYQIETSGRILVLEDVDEYGYRISRMLYHVLNAGLFDNVKAVIFGEFFGKSFTEKDLESVDVEMRRFVKENLQMPCFYIKDFGHFGINHPMVFNVESTIDLVNYSLNIPI